MAQVQDSAVERCKVKLLKQVSDAGADGYAISPVLNISWYKALVQLNNEQKVCSKNKKLFLRKA